MMDLGFAELLTAALAVAAGAFLGGVARGILRQRPGGPAGTLLANLSACLVLGAVLGSGLGGVTGAGGPVGHHLWQLALGTGFSGALSTWSTLAAELGEFIRGRSSKSLAGYTATTLGGGLALFWAGWWLGGTLA